ncbi:MAG: hypothetical protein V1748_12020 [Actinomycetota bacterium]
MSARGSKWAKGSGGAGGERPGKPPFFGFTGAVPEPGVPREKKSAQPEKYERDLETPRGGIHIENYCPAEKVGSLVIDDGICMFSRNNPERQKKALVNVARSKDGNVIASESEGKLVGYIGVHHPSENERWGKPDYDWLFELGAIEVSRNYRHLGLSVEMMHAAWDDPFYDDKVVITTAFTWHWDLESTGLSKLEYRDWFVDLAGRFGFMEMATDEPNVTMDSANLFMVRLGKQASFSRYQKFASMLYVNDWESMLRGF